MFSEACATLARNVQHYRAIRGWSSRTLAEKAGVGERTVNRVEGYGFSNFHSCSVATAEKLSQALDVPLPTLLAALPAGSSNSSSQG